MIPLRGVGDGGAHPGPHLSNQCSYFKFSGVLPIFADRSVTAHFMFRNLATPHLMLSHRVWSTVFSHVMKHISHSSCVLLKSERQHVASRQGFVVRKEGGAL